MSSIANVLKFPNPDIVGGYWVIVGRWDLTLFWCIFDDTLLPMEKELVPLGIVGGDEKNGGLLWREGDTGVKDPSAWSTLDAGMAGGGRYIDGPACMRSCRCCNAPIP